MNACERKAVAEFEHNVIWNLPDVSALINKYEYM